MADQVFHTPLDWRRAKFFLARPTTIPEFDDGVTPAAHSVFVPTLAIEDVLAIRNWLHRMALRYDLLGCYAGLTSLFQGIVFVFDTAADLLLFQTEWAPPISIAA